MADHPAISPDIWGLSQAHPPDAAIAALAARQHGVVARRQLLALGLGERAIEHRLKVGRLHRLQHGVYASGHRVISQEGRWMAAVLTLGPGAVLSHHSAAALWELRPAGRVRSDVIVPRAVRSRGTIAVHCMSVAADERTVHRGVPATTPARTLLDLASVLARPQLERAAEQAEALRLVGPLSLDVLLERHRRRAGTPALRALLEAGRLDTRTRSDLEARFLVLVERAGLPRPLVNTRITVAGRRLEVDFAWLSARVIVEVDGHAHHSSRAAFERDRERDRLLQAAGWRVIRVTWRQLERDPSGVVRDLSALLGRIRP